MSKEEGKNGEKERREEGEKGKIAFHRKSVFSLNLIKLPCDKIVFNAHIWFS